MAGASERTSTSRRRLLQKGAVASGVAIAAGGLAPAAVRAQDNGDSLLERVLDRGHVIVGTGGGNPPWHFEDEDGNLQGFDIEMARLVAKGLFDDPDAIEFEVQAPDARIPNLHADRVDVVFQFMTINAPRAQLAEFTVPYYREAFTLMFAADSPYSSPAELEGTGARIAILQNPTAEAYVHMMVSDAEVEQFDSVANSVLALDAGRVDGTAIDVSTGQWLVAQNPDTYRLAEESYLPQSYAAAVKPGDQRWLNYVNSILREAMVGVEFDAYRDAFQRYFGEEPTPPQAGFPTEFR